MVLFMVHGKYWRKMEIREKERIKTWFWTIFLFIDFIVVKLQSIDIIILSLLNVQCASKSKVVIFSFRYQDDHDAFVS